jgi:fatty acid desaturase
VRPRAWRSVLAVICAEVFLAGLVMYALNWGTWQPPVMMVAGGVLAGLAGKERR